MLNGNKTFVSFLYHSHQMQFQRQTLKQQNITFLKKGCDNLKIFTSPGECFFKLLEQAH